MAWLRVIMTLNNEEVGCKSSSFFYLQAQVTVGARVWFVGAGEGRAFAREGGGGKPTG